MRLALCVCGLLLNFGRHSSHLTQTYTLQKCFRSYTKGSRWNCFCSILLSFFYGHIRLNHSVAVQLMWLTFILSSVLEEKKSLNIFKIKGKPTRTMAEWEPSI